MEAPPRQQQQEPERPGSSDSDLDMEQLSMVDLEAAMSMSVVDAMFSSVLPHYPIGAHIQCRCQVSDKRDLAEGCWIGLFKVGWASAEADCVCRAECRREGERTLVAVFTQDQLPRDTREFYQFCFVCPAGLVKGASSPFLFRGAPSEDFVAELDEELQGVVVSAKTAQLENTLASLREEHAAERSAADEEAAQMRSQLAAVKDRLRDALEQVESAAVARVQLEVRSADAESTAARLRTELAEQQRRLDETRQTVAARLVEAEDERQRLLARLEELSRELEMATDEAAAARKSQEMHAEDRRRAVLEATEVRAEVEQVAAQLQQAEVQLRDAGERETRLMERLGQSETAREKSEAAMAAERTARHELESTLAQMRSELASRQQHEAVSGELRAQQARYASLLTAYDGVKKQFHGADERERLVRVKYDEVIDINKQMLQREERMHARLAELQARLKEGGCEYKKLMKHCRSLQRQMQQQQQMSEAEEFHDAQGDAQFCDADEPADGVAIHRPPPPPPHPQSQPEAAAAAEPERCCPVCNQSEFSDQRKFEEHVNGHF